MKIDQTRYADDVEARRIAGRWQLVAHFSATAAVVVLNARGQERSWASLDTLVRDLARAGCRGHLHLNLAHYGQDTLL